MHKISQDFFGLAGEISSATHQQSIAMENLADNAQKLAQVAESLNSQADYFTI